MSEPADGPRGALSRRFEDWKRRPVTNDYKLLLAIVSGALTLFFLYYVAKGPTAHDRLVALALLLGSAATAAWELWDSKSEPRRSPDADDAGGYDG